MNVALSAVIISILLIHPLIFYVSLFLGKYPKAAPQYTFLEAILACAVISLFIHGISIFFIDQEIRFDILIKLLGGELKDIEEKEGNDVLRQVILSFAKYNLLLSILAFILGRLARWLLIKYNWHSKKNWLNLFNRWWYFFSGYLSDNTGFDFLYVDLVVETKDGTMIYSGLLLYFECKKDELDRIHLQNVTRRPFQKTEVPTPITGNVPDEKLSVPGNVMSFDYSNIININLRFITIENTLAEINNLTKDFVS